jgi:hypothetical protein
MYLCSCDVHQHSEISEVRALTCGVCLVIVQSPTAGCGPQTVSVNTESPDLDRPYSIDLSLNKT